ncbi:MAG TPA: carboxypeptidase-like regulatory domain-containing protein [Bryobacteraceae bacterium]
MRILTKSMLSGPNGEFHFNNLPAGRYLCDAQKFDFDSQPASIADFELPQSPPERAINLALIPYGVIRGTVVNQFGEPLEYVLVVVETAAASPRQIGRLRTDHLGRFSLTRVPPDQYFVKVAGRDGGTETAMGIEKDPYRTWDSFAPAYLDGSHERTSAQPIEVNEGSVVQANFQVELQPAFRVRGKLEGFRQGEPVVFQLLQGNERAEPQRAVVDGVTGDFQLVEVLAGTHTLRATQGRTRGETPLTVGEANTTVSSIALTPGVTINGTKSVIGFPTESLKEEGAPRCEIALHESRRREADPGSGPPMPDEFIFQDVFPGEYRAELWCTRGYPISATFGGVDLMANPIITVTSGPQPPIAVTTQRGGGTLKARVTGEADSEGAMLMLVPSFPTLQEPFLKSLSERVAGIVLFEDLAPGEYRLYAMTMPENPAYWNGYPQSLSGGLAIQIEDGKTNEVTVERISQ